MKKSKAQLKPEPYPLPLGPTFSIRLNPDAEGAMLTALAQRAQRIRGDYIRWLIRREYAQMKESK